VTRPVSKPFSDSKVTDDEFGNGSEARFERRICRKLRKAAKKVEQPHVEQRDLKNLRRIPKRRKKEFRTARLLKISFEDFNFEWSHVPDIQISLTTREAPC